MNRKERRAAQKASGPAASPATAALAQAFRAHQAGHRSDAERLYRDVLAIEPRNAAALHLLGALLHQAAQNDEAVSLMRQAVAIEPRNPDYHYNLGCVLNAAGRADEAVQPLLKAIALRPHSAETHFEAGNVYARIGNFENAENSLRRALDLQPANVAIMNNLGRVLLASGRPADAAAIWEKAVALQPDFAIAHLNIGKVWQEQNRLAEAEQAFRNALTAQPDYAEAAEHLSAVLVSVDRAAEALPMLAAALARKETGDLKAAFAQALVDAREFQPDVTLRSLIQRALEEAWAAPATLAPLGWGIIKAHPAIGALIGRVAGQWGQVPQSHSLLTAAEIDAVAREPLINALLEAAPVTDIAVERFLTVLRTAMLERVLKSENQGDQTIALLSSLARQCFINEYIFAEAEDESRKRNALQASLLTAIRNKGPVAASHVAASAAYGPLHAIENAVRLMDRSWSAPVAALLQQQIEAPHREAAFATGLRRMPADTVEPDHPEQAPSPRWVKAVTTLAPVPLIDSLSAALGRTVQIDFPASPEILIAGCGTGERAIVAASGYRNARVVAVDENCTDLAYGARQAQSLGLETITFAQADVETPDATGLSFDVIDVGRIQGAAGVSEGLSSLARHLRSGGVMRIGFLSEDARRELAAARNFASNGNYLPDPEGLRLLRQNLIRAGADHPAANATRSAEFFAIGTCRTLFFGDGSETPRLAEINDFADKSRFEILGIEAPQTVLRAFAQRFADGDAASDTRTDLSAWLTFEREQDEPLATVCHVWLRKPAR